MLDDYYKGVNHVTDEEERRRDPDGHDYRIANPFAKYIADFQTAYSVGNPITMETDGNHDALDDLNDANNVDSENYRLFLDATRFGRAFEYVYWDNDDEVRFVRLDPMETFMIYTLDVDPQPAMAVRYHSVDIIDDDDTSKEKIVVETWTETEHVVYQPTELFGHLTPQFAEPTKTLQVVEYQNNELRTGDYENVIPSINAYDAAQSDTANYMSDFNDAMLVISGDVDTLFYDVEQTIDPTDEDAALKLAKAKAQALRDMKKARMLLLRSGINAQGQQTSVNAAYIYKQYDVTGTEAYKKRVADDIHKFSHTPNLTDENFAANASGVAMKYKLLGVVELASTKRRMFERGLHQRYDIVSVLMSAGSATWGIESDDIRFTFTDNLPVDNLSQIQQVVQAGATLPQGYLFAQLPDADPDELKEQLKEEREESPYNQLIQQGGVADESADDGEEAESETPASGQTKQPEDKEAD